MRLMGLIGLTVLLGCGGDNDATSDADTETDALLRDAPGEDTGAFDGGTDADPFDAGPPEPCGTEGEMRLATCGRCGMRSERCADGIFVPVSACINEGDCFPASVEMEDTPRCGQRTRLCSSSCRWGEWDLTVPETGECDRGEMRLTSEGCPVASTRPQMCSDECGWEDAGACSSECGTLRTAPWDEEEICVPAGPFWRGEDESVRTDAPRREITLSRFVIDRYVVTQRRYLACRAAGGCPAPIRNADGEAALSDPSTRNHHVWGISYPQAVEFCRWDGDRRLPTEHEWEKAARGPSPRQQPWTWDGDVYRCELLPVFGCPGVTMSIPWTEPVTMYPGAASYYGVEALLGVRAQWVADWFGNLYTSDRDTDVDPLGPTSGTLRVVKGTERVATAEDHAIGYRRGMSEPGVSTGNITFRCARSEPSSE